jgi:hypothetical protein
VVVELLRIRLNWRSYITNLPSAVTGKAEDEWAGATPRLREPVVRFPIAAHVPFSCLLRQRGFFAECSHNGLSGDCDCGSRLACLAEDEQDAGLSRHDIGQDSRRPDAGSQPEPGRAASVAAPAGPRAAPMRFFVAGRGSSCTPRGNSCMSPWLGWQDQLREFFGFGAALCALRRAMCRWTLECSSFPVCGQPWRPTERRAGRTDSKA